jgi:uncharacterized membrane protein YccC
VAAVKRQKDRQDDTPSPRNTLVDDAAERLAKIVAAAERAAEQVIDDAEKQARQLLAEAEAESARIRGELLDVVERLAHELGVDPAAPAPPSRGNHLSAVPLDEPQTAPVATPLEPAAPEHSDRAPGSAAGARLLATQMAVSGSSREEIEAKLRNGFEIEDTGAILDAILGPED